MKERAGGGGAGPGGELTESQRLHLDFWTQFRQYLEDRGSPIRTNRPSKDHWSNVAVGRTNFSLVPWNGMRDNRSGVYLQIAGPQAKAFYGLIEQCHREEVQEKLAPLGNLTWRPLPEAKESQISVVHQSTPSDRETWPELNEWMAKALETMHDLFRPIIRNLKADEFVPEVPAEDADELSSLNGVDDE